MHHIICTKIAPSPYLSKRAKSVPRAPRKTFYIFANCSSKKNIYRECACLAFPAQTKRGNTRAMTSRTTVSKAHYYFIYLNINIIIIINNNTYLIIYIYIYYYYHIIYIISINIYEYTSYILYILLLLYYYTYILKINIFLFFFFRIMENI